MKKWIVLLVSISSIGRAEVEYRTFTAQDGRTLKAAVLAYDAASGKVQILREDKAKLTVQATAFSEKDQAFIKAWAAAQLFLSPAKLKLELKRNEVKDWKKEHEIDMTEFDDAEGGEGRRGGDEGGIRTVAVDKNTQYRFDLILENKGGIPFANVKMEYRIFYEQEKPVEDPATAKQRMKNKEDGIPDFSPHIAVAENKVKAGEVKIKAIEPAGAHTVSTDAVTILKRTATSRPFREMVDLKGELKGAWIKLSMKGPDGQLLVREIALPESLAKKYPWEAPPEEPAPAPEEPPE